MEPILLNDANWSSKMPMWATEKTQAQILEAMKGRFELDNKQLKKFSEVISEVTAGSTNAIEELDSLSAEFKKTKKVSHETNTTNAAFSKGLKKTTDKVKDFSLNLSKYAFGAITGLTALLAGGLTNAFFVQINNYNDLIKAGSLFQDSLRGGTTSMTSFSLMAADARLTVSTLSKVLQTYTAGIRMYGEGRFVRTLRMITDDLSNYGASNAEAADFLGAYIEQQRHLGFVQRMSIDQLAFASSNAYRSISNWSTALGKSREQILKELNETMQNQDVQGFIRDISDPALAQRVKNSVENLSAAITDPKFKDMFFRLATSLVPQADEELRQLMQAGQHELVNEILRFRDIFREGNLDEAATKEFIKSMGNISKNMDREILTAFGPAGIAASNLGLALEQNAERLNEQARSPANDKAQRTIAEFRNNVEQLKSRFELLIGGSTKTIDFFAIINKGLDSFGNFLYNNKDKVSLAIDNIISHLLRFSEWMVGIFSDSSVPIEDRISKFIKDGIVNILFSKEGLIASAIVGAIMIVPSLIKGALISAFSGGKAATPLIYKAVTKGMGGLVNLVGSTFKHIFALGGKIASMPSMTKLPGMLKVGLTGLIKRLPIIGALIFGTASAIDSITSTEGSWYQRLLEGTMGMADGMVKAFTSLPTMIIDWIFGSDLTGFITDRLDSLKQRIRGFFDGLTKIFSSDKKDVPENIEPSKNLNKMIQNRALAAIQLGNEKNNTISRIKEPTNRSIERVYKTDTVNNEVNTVEKFNKVVEASKESKEDTKQLLAMLSSLVEINQQVLGTMIDNNKNQKTIASRLSDRSTGL